MTNGNKEVIFYFKILSEKFIIICTHLICFRAKNKFKMCQKVASLGLITVLKPCKTYFEI